MKKLFIVLAFLFSASVAQAKDIQLLNPEFLGQPTSSSIKLLYDKKSDEIEPYVVTTDIKCSKYNASSVFYPTAVTFAQARESLNKLYKKYEKQNLYQESVQALWRIEKKRFGVHLVQEENRVRIMYIQFQSTEAVMTSIMKSSGADVSSIEDDDCNEEN
jgi:hypothetical protein